MLRKKAKKKPVKWEPRQTYPVLQADFRVPVSVVVLTRDTLQTTSVVVVLN